MLFPVSPRYLLFAEFADRPDGTHKAKAEFVQDVRRPIFERAHLQIYASFFSKELQDQVTKEFSQRGSLYEPSAD